MELRSRYLDSFPSMPSRFCIWPGRRPSTSPLLLPVKYLMAARTDSDVDHNGRH